MSKGQDNDTEKSHEATQLKLAEVRKKGEFARSADLNTAAGYAGFILAVMAAGAASITSVSNAMMVLLSQPRQLAGVFFADEGQALLGSIIWAIFASLFAWFLCPAACALMSVFAQNSMVFAPSKLKPKFSRISPLANAKNKFGPSGLFEFAKNFCKIFLYSVLLAAFLKFRLPEMAGSLNAEPGAIGVMMARILIDFMLVVLLIAVCVGGIDYAWQYFDHLRRNRMSHQEVKEEHKQNEGDPHMKQERRNRAMQAASEHMMKDVRDAEVVLMNPTHYAVALKWSRLSGAAPICVAKGADHIAMTIRDIAMEHGVPVRQDAPTARTLYATTEIGAEIDQKHYRAVAAAIRFSEAMRLRARAWT